MVCVYERKENIPAGGLIHLRGYCCYVGNYSLLSASTGSFLAARRAGIVRVNPINGTTIHTIQVGTSTYKKDAQGKFTKVGARPKPAAATKGGKQQNLVQFEVGNNANCVIAGETVAGASFSCTCKLQFH